jgi:hypothetical protein
VTVEKLVALIYNKRVAESATENATENAFEDNITIELFCQEYGESFLIWQAAK